MDSIEASKILVTRIPSYTSKIPDGAFEGMPVFRGETLFLKPNLVVPPTPTETQSCTHWKIAEALISYLIEHDAGKIIIGDCGFKNQWERTIAVSGYQRMARRFKDKVQLIGLQEGPLYHEYSLIRSTPGYLSLFGAKISNTVLNCDGIIDIPKMKMHSMAYITGAIKNLMGVMAQKGSMHPKGSIPILHKRLCDLYFLLKDRVVWCFMDGVVGSEFCEQTGCPVDSGLIISGKDPWEVDCVASKAMGVDPSHVPYLVHIQKKKQRNFPDISLPQGLPIYEKPMAWRSFS